MGILGWVVVTLVVAFVVAILPYNLKIVRAQRALARMPAAFREDVLRKIDEAGRVVENGIVLWVSTDATQEARAFEATSAGDLLVAVRLARPSLPTVWRERWLVARDVSKEGKISIEWLDAPPRAEIARALRPVALPVRALGDEPIAVELVARVNGLEAILRARYGDPAALLTQVLSPEGYAHTLEADAFPLVEADAPFLVQGEHDARCRTCGCAMRFLFQAGCPLKWKGESRVTYVYGCDEHVDVCVGFIDFY